MNLFQVLGTCFTLTCAALAQTALAQEPIKIGMVVPLSGPFTSYGQQAKNGITAFMHEHGDTVAGRKIDIIYRDTAGPTPEAAKRLAQELVNRDKVDLLGGFLITPQAFASAPIATASKTPMFVMLAATSGLTKASPYIISTSYTNAQMAYPLGKWAAKNHIKKVYSLVADFAPGHDSEAWFKKGFTEGGGTVIEAVRMPPSNLDFGPFVQRIKDAKPDAAFVFLQAGDSATSFIKEAANRKLAQAGIKILALEGFTDEDTLASVGDAALGIISAGFYTPDYDHPMNRRFLAESKKIDQGKLPPNFIAVAAYDAMQIIYKVIEKQGGKVNGDETIKLATGMQINSPRGTLLIDKDTRDTVQHIYMRKIERIDGKLVNRNFDQTPMIKDPS